MVNMTATSGKLQYRVSSGFLVLSGEQSCELISRRLLEHSVSVLLNVRATAQHAELPLCNLTPVLLRRSFVVNNHAGMPEINTRRSKMIFSHKEIDILQFRLDALRR